MSEETASDPLHATSIIEAAKVALELSKDPRFKNGEAEILILVPSIIEYGRFRDAFWPQRCWNYKDKPKGYIETIDYGYRKESFEVHKSFPAYFDLKHIFEEISKNGTNTTSRLVGTDVFNFHIHSWDCDDACAIIYAGEIPEKFNNHPSLYIRDNGPVMWPYDPEWWYRKISGVKDAQKFNLKAVGTSLP